MEQWKNYWNQSTFARVITERLRECSCDSHVQTICVQISESKQQLLTSCLLIIEAAFILCRSDPDFQGHPRSLTPLLLVLQEARYAGTREQLDETFHCAFSAVIGFLTALQTQVICYFYRTIFVQSTVLRSFIVRLSVCLCVTFRYRDHICWNSSKIISRPNSLRPLLGPTPTWAIWCNVNTPKIGAE